MMENMEVWKDCKGYEGLYQVSNMGRVWSVRKQRYMKPYNANGYLKVDLCAKNGKRKKEYVHRLVALVFVENPYNLPFVNHKDENRLNPKSDNLEWCTAEYNNNYGTMPERISKTLHNYSQPISQYDADGNFIRMYDNPMDVAKALNCSRSNVYECLSGRSRTCCGYILERTNKKEVA